MKLYRAGCAVRTFVKQRRALSRRTPGECPVRKSLGEDDAIPSGGRHAVDDVGDALREVAPVVRQLHAGLVALRKSSLSCAANKEGDEEMERTPGMQQKPPPLQWVSSSSNVTVVRPL